jgi:hypothetical protein
MLIKKLPMYSWNDADFNETFRELDQMTAGFQDLDFQHLQKILHLQENTSKEGLEVFGVKIPTESTTRWGIILIIAIQLYLWLHLREYRHRGIMAPPVAWIGSYSQLSAPEFFSSSLLSCYRPQQSLCPRLQLLLRTRRPQGLFLPWSLLL